MSEAPSNYPPPTALVLVAVVPSPRDLEIARVLGWYRIPLKSAPKVIAVDYLAFYQTAAFSPDERWRINYISPVYGHELTWRRELLRDEPNHPRADEEYYKIQIGPLQRLPQPIVAENWRRLTFLYTTGELLSRAHRLQDLALEGEERVLVWRSLRERAAHQHTYNAATLPEGISNLDAVMLEFLGLINL
ncbi:hypothetical protein QYE77_14245 [Thermanaerothrix sp. 4228-RoL]|uniref:Uncharacterized protein n=1 Tax=Thermanaerothrix solaris TaxID=3058434 RepID=A0ABU3NRG0_9CHLR|nr:hypothetical protein [Thermanaerothrix sp. 4228-RoL]MDT8899422.1 hypothetical protein [Thermanaerothrix sp. 4228-RoL]